jgi:hypothetical protein
MIQRRLGRPMVVAAILFAATSAQASRNETAAVHGTICQQDSNSGHPFYVLGGVSNDQASALQVGCPIPISTMSSSNAVSIGASGQGCSADAASNPWVDVFDRHRTQDVSCTLLLLDETGSVLSSFNVQTSGFASGVTRLFFNTGKLTVLPGHHLVGQCIIPGPDADLSYVADFGVPMCESF